MVRKEWYAVKLGITYNNTIGYINAEFDVFTVEHIKASSLTAARKKAMEIAKAHPEVGLQFEHMTYKKGANNPWKVSMTGNRRVFECPSLKNEEGVPCFYVAVAMSKGKVLAAPNCEIDLGGDKIVVTRTGE